MLEVNNFENYTKLLHTANKTCHNITLLNVFEVSFVLLETRRNKKYGCPSFYPHFRKLSANLVKREFWNYSKSRLRCY
jgi:hypothetical protein